MRYPKTKKIFILKPSLICILGTLPFAANPAFAQSIDYVWDGSTDNNFRNESNWSPEHTPGWNDNLIINTSTPGQTPVLTIDDWGSGSNPIEQGNNLIIGTGNNANGILLINFTDDANGNADLLRLSVGMNGGTGVLNITRNEYVESDPYGYGNGVRIQSGYDISNDGYGVILGSGSGSQGTINVLGQGKSIEQQSTSKVQLQSSSMKVGENQGSGVLNINGASTDIGSAGSTHELPNFIIGDGSGSQGTVNILNGGKLSVNTYNNYLQAGSATDHTIIGFDGGSGAINISGKSDKGDISRATIGNGIAVGKGTNSQGAINITNGGSLTSMEGEVEYGTSIYTKTQLGSDGGTGNVFVSGENSIWKHAGNTSIMMNQNGTPGTEGILYIGGENKGTGSLTINNGGKVTLGQLEYEHISEYDPISDTYTNYHQEKEFIGGVGTIHLAETSDSTGTINIGSAEGYGASGAGILDTKEIIFGDGTGTIVFNHTDNTGEYVFDQYDDNGTLRDTNQLVGDGTLKNMNGVTVLNTDQSTFTGKIFASGGVLEVNNVLGGTMEVNGSGTLAGVGTVGNTTVKSGGTLAPGKYNDASASTLTVDGDLNMNAGSTLSVNISANLNSGGIYGESDLVDVLGQANINGTKVHVNKLAGSYIIDTKWNILSAAGGVAGTFGELSQNRPFVSLGYEYDANNAYLVVTRNATGYCVDGMSFNQCSAGNNIDGQGAGSLLNNVIAGQSSIDAAKRAFDLLSGEIHASAKGAALEDSRFLREAINNRMQDTIKAGETGAWAHAFGSWGTFDGDGNAADMKRDISGVFFGVDAAANDTWQLGMVAGYSRADIKADQRKSSADRDDYHIGAYTSAKWGQTSFRAGVGHTLHEYSTNRNVNIEGLSENLTAKYDANTTQVFAEGSHKVPFGLATVEPFVNAAYVNHYSENFTEKGGIASLSSSSDNTEMFYTTIGARLVTNFKLSNTSSLKAWGMAGWRHAYNSVTPDANLNFQGEQGFNIRGTPIARDVAALELGLEATVTPTVKVGLMYNGQVGSKVSDHGAKAYLNWVF